MKQIDMARLCIVVFTFWAIGPTYLIGQSLLPAEREAYVSDASFWLAQFQPEANDHSTEAMVRAANALIESLDASLQKQLRFDLKSPERRQWTNLPARRSDTAGLRFGDLNQSQINAACQLLATLMSERGFQKMREIMLADDQLLNGGRPRDGFGTENYFLCIFGTPDKSEPWAVQLDGHHIGVNLSISGPRLTISPSFIGTQPQTFRIGNASIRPLKGEIDTAYKLVNSLSDPQRLKAVLKNQRGRIVSGPGNDGKAIPPEGLACDSLNETQRKLLFDLISQWINDLPEQHAQRRLGQLKNEIDSMRFLWNGELEEGSDISYRIQSPSLIIEYACQDLGGDPQQHLHTMYRDPKNEYGGQLK